MVADLPEAARTARLSQLCGDDSELRQEVESLLSFDAKTAPFQPAVAETAAALDGPELTHAGPYRIVREIGRGGMGAVYLATRDDDEFQREVAVKIVKRGMDTDAIVQRFRTERQILVLLEHPRIARLYEAAFYSGEKACDLHRQAGPYLEEANRRAVKQCYWRPMTAPDPPRCP